MNKNIIKIGLFFFATILITSCNDEFLERYPLDEISESTFWTSESDLKVYNNSIYEALTDDDKTGILTGHNTKFKSTRTSLWFLDEATDNMVANHSRHARYQELRAGQQQNNKRQWHGYQGWDILRSINVGIENYNKAPLDQSVIDIYMAEAKLFRGWFYADKVAKFNDVQWINHELNTDSPELYGERDSREMVMDSVLADLNFACKNLPEFWIDAKDPGRMDKWCALFVKSRVCLFEGTWRKYHGGSNANMWLEESAKAAKEIIDGGQFAIYTTGDVSNAYNDMFRHEYVAASNPEVIYYIKYETGIRSNNVIKYFYSADASGYCGGATKSMVEDYLCTDGLPINLSPLYEGDATIEKVFENRDPRLRQTVLHPEDKEYYKYRNDELDYPRFTGMPGGALSSTGYHIIKTFNADVLLLPHNGGQTPSIVMRYAEVLLNYAEAQEELGLISQADINMTINAIRDRVGMAHLDISNVPVDPRYTSDGISPLLAEIRRERRIEMFMEGLRYDDLRRWKQGAKLQKPDMGLLWDAAAEARYDRASVKTSVDPDNGKTYIEVFKGTDFEVPVFDESKHYLWPIPINDISENPNLGQNPGW